MLKSEARLIHTVKFLNGSLCDELVAHHSARSRSRVAMTAIMRTVLDCDCSKDSEGQCDCSRFVRMLVESLGAGEKELTGWGVGLFLKESYFESKDRGVGINHAYPVDGQGV